MRIIYSAGQAAKRGTYLDPVTGQRHDLPYDGSVLPGKGGSKYLRMPPGGMLPLAFVIGFFYVLLLPFIGIATLVSIYIIPMFGVASGVLVVSGRAVGAFLEVIGRSVSFGWRPSSAYLAGKKKKRVRPADGADSGKEETK